MIDKGRKVLDNAPILIDKAGKVFDKCMLVKCLLDKFERMIDKDGNLLENTSILIDN